MAFLRDCHLNYQMQWYLPTLPNFIPVIAWLFLKEKSPLLCFVPLFSGFIGVFCVAKPDQGLLNWISVIGIASSLLASMAFVTFEHSLKLNHLNASYFISA